jgi:NitT/TauT family transport system ATP-binding protein
VREEVELQAMAVSSLTGRQAPDEAATATPTFSLENVGKVYKRRQQSIVAMDSISLDVQQGEFVALLGPSGCGKSTCLRIMAGLTEATSGRVAFNGEESRGVHEDKVGIVFQSATLLPWRTVEANVYLPLQVRGNSWKEAKDKVHELLCLVGLQDFAKNHPSELSGGMQQRVGIARALSVDPEALLLDEPFGALDALTREVMNLELMDIWMRQRSSVVLVTHSIDEAVFMANRVVLMSNRPSRIVEDVTVELPYPRGVDVMSSPEFTSYTGFLRRRLFEESGALK